MGKLEWKYGSVHVRIARDQNIGQQRARAEYDLRKGAWREYIGWSAGPFTVHTTTEDTYPDTRLSHRETGCMISRSKSIHRAFALAEELADLDWSGPVEEFRARNAEAVVEAERKLGGEHAA